jgi:hypothetical protein
MNFIGDSSTAAVSRGTTHREMPIRSYALAANLAEDMPIYSVAPIHLTNRPERSRSPKCMPDKVRLILNINATTPFGSIQDKGDQRRFFKGSVRLNF